MSIKKFYYYLFYKFYKFWEYVSVPKFWSDFKASVSIMALEIWLVLSLINYYNIYVNRSFHLEKNTIIILAGIIFFFDYLIFNYKDKWKEYNKEFDQLPKEVNKRGSIIVFVVTLFIIINLIFSFYLMSQIDWSQYK